MPALQIHITNNSWVATIANTNVDYRFVGANIGDQETAVQQLSAAMQEGQEALTNGISEVLQIGDTPPAQAVQDIFNTTDVLMYEDRILFSAVGDEMLLDDIVDAGIALAGALVQCHLA